MPEIRFSPEAAEAIITPIEQDLILGRAQALVQTGEALRNVRRDASELQRERYGIITAQHSAFFVPYDSVLGKDVEGVNMAEAYLLGAGFMYKTLELASATLIPNLDNYTFRPYPGLSAGHKTTFEDGRDRVDGIREQSGELRSSGELGLLALRPDVVEGLEGLEEVVVSDVRAQSLFRVGAGLVIYDTVVANVNIGAYMDADHFKSEATKALESEVGIDWEAEFRDLLGD